MNDIDITSTNETEPLPICRRSREGLVSKYHLVEMIALEYFEARKTHGKGEQDPEDVSLAHLLKCPKCRDWFYEAVPSEILKRQKRLTQYCCAGMFCAVEENKERNQPEVEFTLFRGEDPCWLIDGKQSCISFCPWCGEKLPEKPF